MSKKGWLSKQDFDSLDSLLSKLGYGGYYDFLECLKHIASQIGAVYVMEKQDLRAWDLQDVKTIPDIMALLSVWSDRVANYRQKNPSWIDEVLKK